MHGACYSPCVDTWCKAIEKGYFKTWPGLTSARVRRYVKMSEATSKGHLTQERQNLRSTKTKVKQLKQTTSNEASLTKNPEAYVCIDDPRHHSTVYSDQTGRFPVRSNRGMHYIMILYETTSNYIFAEAMKDRTENSMITAFNKFNNNLFMQVFIQIYIYWIMKPAKKLNQR